MTLLFYIQHDQSALSATDLKDRIVDVSVTGVFPDVGFDGTLVLTGVATKRAAKPPCCRIMHKGRGLCVLTGVLSSNRFDPV